MSDLIKAMKKYYEKLGIIFDESDIYTKNDSNETLLFSINTITNHGEEIPFPEPFYTNYIGFSITVEVEVKAVTISPERGFRLPLKEDLNAL
jgi:aspartate aminotransferase